MEKCKIYPEIITVNFFSHKHLTKILWESFYVFFIVVRCLLKDTAALFSWRHGCNRQRYKHRHSECFQDIDRGTFRIFIGHTYLGISMDITKLTGKGDFYSPRLKFCHFQQPNRLKRIFLDILIIYNHLNFVFLFKKYLTQVVGTYNVVSWNGIVELWLLVNHQPNHY